MSFTNDRFQIFVNKTPLANNSSNTSILTQPQSNTHVKTFTLSTGGLFQGNLLENSLNTATLSSENLHGTTNSFNDYQGNVYVKDNFGSYDNEFVQTPTYPDDSDENHYGSGLSNASKKIRKDMLSSNARTWGNKKAMQEELKMKTKRNPWQPEEDEQVLDLVAKYGQSWALIASLMKERSGKQIRDRYLNKLRPDINKGEWTEREDEILISFCTKIGHKWSRIATHLPGRTEGQVKNRFYSHIKKRLPKWHTAGIPEQSEEDELYQDETEFDHKRHTIKQEAMGFGMNNGAHVNKKILCLNSGNVQSNTGFGSFNIKVNTLGQTMDGAKFLVNRADPTDVISYGGLANMHVKTHYTTADDAKSPYQLSSTRASSLSQDKDFEENYGKMSKMWTEGAQANKGKMISFSLLNGNIVPTQKPVMTQQVNKLDFSSGQGKISLNIF